MEVIYTVLNLPDLKGWGVGKLNTDLPQGNQDTGNTSWTGDKVDDVMKNFQVSLPAVNQVCYYRVGLLFPSEWTTHFTRLNSNKSNKAHSSILSIQFTVFCTHIHVYVSHFFFFFYLQKIVTVKVLHLACTIFDRKYFLYKLAWI